MTSAVGFVFPGQGSQAVGMGRSFWEQWPPAKEFFSLASLMCGADLEALCFDGPRERLALTENAQPAIFTVSCICAGYAAERGVLPDVVAGHSLGEYAALVAAGVCEFEAALEVVCRRGKLMSEAASSTDGMAAVLGLPLEAVRSAIADMDDVGVANENCPEQTVISGSLEGIVLATDRLKSAGAKRVVRLAVSGAFHTEKMRGANSELAPLLEALVGRDASVPVVQNATGKAATGRDDLLAGLKAQMTSPVKWESCTVTMLEMGVETFVELGPGNVLKGLVQRCRPESIVLCVGEPEALTEVEERVAIA